MKHVLPLILLAAGLSVSAAQAAETVIAPNPTSWTQPENMGLLAKEVTRYHDNGDYLRDVTVVDKEVQDWILAQAPKVAKPALVLDIDETSLSNWDEMKADGFGYFAGPCDALPKGPCGWTGWEHLQRAPALPPTLTLFRAAKAHGIAVFFVTGRHEEERADTAANLSHAGYADWDGLVLEPTGKHFHDAAAYKAPARAAIEAKGYAILATVGDQRSDLTGGYAQRGFLLPNPFYFIP